MSSFQVKNKIKAIRQTRSPNKKIKRNKNNFYTLLNLKFFCVLLKKKYFASISIDCSSKSIRIKTILLIFFSIWGKKQANKKREREKRVFIFKIKKEKKFKLLILLGFQFFRFQFNKTRIKEVFLKIKYKRYVKNRTKLAQNLKLEICFTIFIRTRKVWTFNNKFDFIACFFVVVVVVVVVLPYSYN